MAIISLKNLVAPVTNKLHLFSIMFVVLLFGFLRWSGGEFRAGWLPKSSGAAESGDARSKRPGTFKPQKSGTITVTDEQADDLLNSMLGSGQGTPGRNEPRAVEQKPKQRSNPAAFDDIERSLGLK